MARGRHTQELNQVNPRFVGEGFHALPREPVEGLPYEKIITVKVFPKHYTNNLLFPTTQLGYVPIVVEIGIPS